MKKIFYLFLIALLFTGCVQKPKFIGTAHVYKNNTFDTVYTLSKKCFERESNFFTDGIVVQAKGNNIRGVITFHRYAFDIGLTEPFIILKFKNNEIKIYEAPYDVGLNGYKKFNIKSHIDRWLKGDFTCGNKRD